MATQGTWQGYMQLQKLSALATEEFTGVPNDKYQTMTKMVDDKQQDFVLSPEGEWYKLISGKQSIFSFKMTFEAEGNTYLVKATLSPKACVHILQDVGMATREWKLENKTLYDRMFMHKNWPKEQTVPTERTPTPRNRVCCAHIAVSKLKALLQCIGYLQCHD